MKFLVVGEQPSGALGLEGPLGGQLATRLAGIAGCDREKVLAYERVNLLDWPDRWDATHARKVADWLDECGPPVEFLLLGARVGRAFSVTPPRPFLTTRSLTGRRLHLLPHPSGRNRLWNDPANRVLARRFLTTIGF